MQIIFSGSGEFGLPTLQSLAQKGHEVMAVYTQPDRPAGRGRKLTPTPIAEFALSQKWPVIRTEQIDRESLPVADLMVVIAFGQKIGPAAAAHPRLGSVNLHASRLPKYRGAAPINWAILDGQTITGNSVIRLVQRMDAGDILAQSSLTIGETETAGELHDRLALDGAELIQSVISQLSAGKEKPIVQDESQASRAPKLTREFSQIDWHKSAEEISQKIRGLHPWPGCRVELTDASGSAVARLTLARSRPVPSEGPRWHPGEINMAQAVETGKGAVEILELQPEGKRVMPLSDFIRGHTWICGMKLRSIGTRENP